ncbi:MAG: hypothetical protein U0798_03645 [Gemmataceae bacterium]
MPKPILIGISESRLDEKLMNCHTAITKPRMVDMNKSRMLFCLSIIAILSVWAIVRPSGNNSASAQSQSVNDPFSEENALSHYASSQPHHWRQMLIKK